MTRNPENLHQLPTTPTSTASPERYLADDDISMVDLWLVLMRHRMLLFLVLAMSFLAGSIIAFTEPNQYSYTASIEIGTRVARAEMQPTEIRLIDEPQSLLAEVQESYIPIVLQEYRLKHPESGTVFAVTARAPEKSKIIVLEGRGTAEQKEMYLNLLNAILEKVKSRHRPVHEFLKKEVEIQRNKVAHELTGLDEELNMLQAEMERVEKTKGFLQEQVKETRRRLDVAEGQRKATERGNGMSLFLLDEQILAARRQLSELRERQEVGLESERQALGLKSNEIRRLQSEKRDELGKLEAELANFQETRALAAPMQSNRPIGPGRSLMMALSLVVGGFLGILASFGAEFLNKVRETQRSEEMRGPQNMS